MKKLLWEREGGRNHPTEGERENSLRFYGRTGIEAGKMGVKASGQRQWPEQKPRNFPTWPRHGT